MEILNQNAPLEVYRTFDRLLRQSRLSATSGTIILSMEHASLDIGATVRADDPQATQSHLIQAKTPERLFAQVFSFVVTASMR